MLLFKHLACCGRCANVARTASHLICWALTAAIAAGGSGCSSLSDMTWLELDSSRAAAATAKPVIVIGALANPPASMPGWETIGTDIGRAMRQQLLRYDQIDLRYDSALTADVALALAGPSHLMNDRLRRLAARYPTVRYVVTGRVTEFAHTTRQTGTLNQTRDTRPGSDAVVNIELAIVDLPARKVVGRGQFTGRAWAGDQVPAETYRGLSFTSARFSETPLGLASRDAVIGAAEHIMHLAPPPERCADLIRIVSRTEPRRVQLASNAKRLAVTGDVLHVCVFDHSGVRLQPVIDPATQQPLTARIEAGSWEPSAWLQGEPPEDLDLRGAVLCRMLPS